MAKRKEVVHVFHLYRKDGVSIFLHPFRHGDRPAHILEKSEIVGHYGAEPRVESMTLFRNELYRLVEQQVKAWVADARFVPRFVLSSFFFLLAYLFLSFVVRDPIPVLDEVAISLGVAIVSWILLGRRDLKSDMALKKRIALRSRVDAVVFTESQFIRKLETALESKETTAVGRLVDEVMGAAESELVAGHEEEAAQLVRYLERTFRASDFRKSEKRIRRLTQGRNGKDRETVRRWLESRKVDVPLLALYLQLKRGVKTQA